MDHRYKKGFEFYSKRFEHCNNATYVVDATPNYLGSHSAERVYETYSKASPRLLSELKLIVSVREPIARELSLYNHMKSR